jgi:hypothetical protein
MVAMPVRICRISTGRADRVEVPVDGRPGDVERLGDLLDGVSRESLDPATAHFGVLDVAGENWAAMVLADAGGCQ